MEKLKAIPHSTISKVRTNPSSSGLMYEKFGKSTDIKDYSDREISEMILGIYRDKKILLVDGDYFVDLNKVTGTICVLDEVTYFKKPTDKDYKSNAHNSIKNIRTFYIKDYYLITSDVQYGQSKHRITRFLYKAGSIRLGRHKFNHLYSCSNYYATLQLFKDGNYPKDLYHPIKRYINGLFFNDDYMISDFKVESRFLIEN